MSLLLIFQSEAASEALAGTSALTFTPAGGLLTDEALAGSASLTFTPSGLMVNSCSPAFQFNAFQFDAFDMCVEPALLASSGLIFTPSADLQGAGVLAGSTTISFTTTPAAPLQGFGPTLPTSLTFTPAATPTGAFAPVGSTTLFFTLNGSVLQGAGVLQGAAGLTFTGSATAFLAGAIIGSTSLTFTVVGTGQTAGTVACVGTTTFRFTPALQSVPPINPAAHPIIPRIGELFDDEQRERRDRQRRKQWKRTRNERNKLRRMLDAQYEGVPFVDEDEIEGQAVVVANLVAQVEDLPLEDLLAVQELVAQAHQWLRAREVVKAEIELALQLSREMLKAKDEEDAIIALMMMET